MINNAQKKSEKIAPLLIISGAALWGIMGVFVNTLKSFGFTSMSCSSIRTISAAVLITVYMLIFNRSSLKIKLRDIPYFLGTGILSMLLLTIVYFKSILINGMTTASILMYVEPLFVMILSAMLFKDKITPIKVISIIIAFTGCVLVSGIGTQNSLSALGIACGLLSAITYGLYSIFSVYLIRKNYEPLTITTYSFIFSAIGITFFTDWKNTVGIASSIGIEFLAVAVLMGLVSAVMPYVLYTIGLKNVKPSKAAIMSYVEPLVAAIIGISVYNERITVFNFLGMLMIAGSVIILNIRQSKQ